MTLPRAHEKPSRLRCNYGVWVTSLVQAGQSRVQLLDGVISRTDVGGATVTSIRYSFFVYPMFETKVVSLRTTV